MRNKLFTTGEYTNASESGKWFIEIAQGRFCHCEEYDSAIVIDYDDSDKVVMVIKNFEKNEFKPLEEPKLNKANSIPKKE